MATASAGVLLYATHAIAITGKSNHDAALNHRRMLEQDPDVGTNCYHCRFPPANCLVIDHALVPWTLKWLNL